jgi:branched-chain amino acid transport system substrate-binding protein
MSYYTDAALIAQQARSQGLTVDIVANGATYSPKFIELGGEAVEGVYTTSPWFVGNPRPAVQEFVKKFKEKYNEEPNWFAGNAYDTVMILAHVIEKVGTDRKAIRDGLAGLKDYPSLVYGTLSFNEQRRATIKEFNRLTVKGGTFTIWKAS